MKKEISYFKIGTAVGGNQEWFQDKMMYLGGCAAVTACDICLHLALSRGMDMLYPFDKRNVTREDFLKFGKIMKPYLRPRISGIDTLDIYLEGIARYWKELGVTNLTAEGFDGSRPLEEAKAFIRGQIEKNMPIPCLILRHKDPGLKDFVWHWFNLAGYQEYEDIFLVKVVSYGEIYWFDFANLWDTGHRRKGGMIAIGEV